MPMELHMKPCQIIRFGWQLISPLILHFYLKKKILKQKALDLTQEHISKHLSES